jgi:hypothetical protein
LDERGRGRTEESVKSILGCGRRAGTAAGASRRSETPGSISHDAFTPVFSCAFSIFLQASQLLHFPLKNHEKKSRMTVKARDIQSPLFNSKLDS